MKLFVGGVKLSIFALAGVCHFRAIILMREYIRQGSEFSDSVHTVLVNSHGMYRYISESDFQNYQFCDRLGTFLIVVMIVLVFIEQSRR